VKLPSEPLLLLVVFVFDFRLRDNLFAAVKTVRRNPMPQVRLTRGWVDGHRRVLQFVMRTPHTAP
jgi:hypothetical protein